MIIIINVITKPTILSILFAIILLAVLCFTNYQLYGLLRVCISRILSNDTYIEKSNIAMFEERLKYGGVQHKPISFYNNGSKFDNWRSWMGTSVLQWIFPFPTNKHIKLCTVNESNFNYALSKDQELLDKHIAEYRQQGFSERAIESIIKRRNEEMQAVVL